MRYYRDEQVDDLQKDYEWVSWTRLLTRFFTFHTAVYQSMSDVPRIRSLSVINTFDTDRVFVICFSNTLLTHAVNTAHDIARDTGVFSKTLRSEISLSTTVVGKRRGP